MYPYIQITEQLKIPSYGLMLVLAVALGVLLALKRAKRFGIKKDDVIYAACFIGVGALLGSKLLYALTMLPWIVENFSIITTDFRLFMTVAFGGLVYYGGFIGGVLGLLVYCRKYKIDKWALLNIIIPSVPLMHAIGRVGCFLAGCCYGCPADPPFGVVFSHESTAPQGVALLPVQLYEAGINLVLCLVLYLIGNRTRKKTAVLGAYLIGYGVERFVLEFFRYDAIRGVWGGFSTSQWISLILIPIGIILLATKRIGNIEPIEEGAADTVSEETEEVQEEISAAEDTDTSADASVPDVPEGTETSPEAEADIPETDEIIPEAETKDTDLEDSSSGDEEAFQEKE